MGTLFFKEAPGQLIQKQNSLFKKNVFAGFIGIHPKIPLIPNRSSYARNDESSTIEAFAKCIADMCNVLK